MEYEFFESHRFLLMALPVWSCYCSVHGKIGRIKRYKEGGMKKQ